jgi:thiamine pyrophosphokinase
VALREIAKGTDLLAAADSGLVAAEEAGLNPDWVIGDMDSLGNMVSLDDLSRLGKYPPDRVIRYPTDKDFTDTELAIALLREKGCDEIWLAGGGGGRTDHLFAIFSLFESDHSGVVRPDRWFTANEEIRCLREGRALDATLPPGNLVSVFPLGLGPWEAESSGLKWPLDGLAWERGGLGLSNVAAAGVFKIRSVQGRFMVMWALPYI